MATSTIQKQYIVEAVTTSAVTAAATSGINASVDATKSGYTPVGIVGVRKTIVGSGSVTSVLLSSFSISSQGVASATFYNVGGVDRKFTVTFIVLYEKSS